MSLVSSGLPTTHAAKKAFAISLSLHLVFISFLVASALVPQTPPPIPHRLVVQSIALHPHSRHLSTVLTSSLKPASKRAEDPPSPPPLPPEPTPNPPTQEVIAETAEAEAPVEPPPKAPAVEEQEVKKGEQKTKQQATHKTTATEAKGKPSSSQKSKPTGSTTSSTSKTCQKKSISSQKPAYDQKLLQEALHRLDKSKSAAGKGGGGVGGGKGGGSGKATSSVSHVGAVGSLHADQGFVTNGSSEESPYEEYLPSSPEACYIGDLIRRLQLNIRLPEPGEVKVKLTLKSNGSVFEVTIVSGKSAAIKRTIEEKLRAIHFSPFGGSFSGETEHTFCLRLSNELVWSCW